jgi:ectoine hydroxylase-related dioxygenase (phytanoyl-CoA dioxygenase family)
VTGDGAPGDARADDTARRFAEHGFLITPPLFDDTALAAVCGEIERLWQQRAGRGPAKDHFAVVRPELPRLHHESPTLAAFCRHPAFCDLARTLIGPDADVMWNQSYVKAPDRGAGLTAIPWHQDGYYAEIDSPAYNCWVAITPMTVENGTVSRAAVPAETSLLPHVWDDKLLFYRCEVDEELAEPVVLEPGQAFVYHGRIPHKSGPNLSRAARIAYGVSFTSASARLKTNGQPFGDRVPLLRGGESAFDQLAAYAVDASPAPEHGGARIVDEIEARAPEKARELHALLTRYRTERSAALLDRALGLLPDDPEVHGDRAGARARTDQLWTELRTIQGADPGGAQVLLRRILELDPRDRRAAEELERLR